MDNKTIKKLVKVNVTEDDHKIKVKTLAPILIEAAELGFSKGIDKLQALASLPSINHSVPVMFELSFTKQK